MALYGFRPAQLIEPALSRRTSTEGGSAGRAKSLLSELMARAEAAGGQNQHPNREGCDEDGWMQGEEDEGLYDEEEEESDEQQQEEDEGGMPVPSMPIEVLKYRRSYLQRLLYSREVEEMLLQAQSWITSQPAGKACVQARLCLSAASLLKHQQHAARQQGF